MERDKKRLLSLKLGGSFVTDQEGVIEEGIRSIIKDIAPFLFQFDKVLLEVGGGEPARKLQTYFKDRGVTDPDRLNKAGIVVTQRHAQEIINITRGMNLDVYPDAPTSIDRAQNILTYADSKFLVMGGTVPGQSTDAVAVEVAERGLDLGYEPVIIILSNIAAILMRDPRPITDEQLEDEKAQIPFAIKTASLKMLLEEDILSNTFAPGQKTPIDAEAARAFIRMTKRKVYLTMLFTDRTNMSDITAYLANNGKFAEPETATILTGNRYGARITTHTATKSREIIKATRRPAFLPSSPTP